MTFLFSSLAASLSSPLVGDGTLVGRVCRILGYGIGLADVIMLCDLHYILSSVLEIRLTLKASSVRKLLESRVQSCTGPRGPPGALCSRNPGDQAPVVKSADTATLKVAALGHAGSRPAGGTRSRTGDPVFLHPVHPAALSTRLPGKGCAGQFLMCPASEVLRECVTTPLLFTIIVGPLVEATTTAVSAWAACSAISAAWNCFCK